MNAKRVYVKCRMDLITPDAYEVMRIGKVVSSQPDSGRCVILCQIIPVRGVKVANWAASDKLSRGQQKKNVENDPLLSIGSQRVTLWEFC